MPRIVLSLLFILAFSSAASDVSARQPLTLVHALEGVPRWELEQLAGRFNKSQAEFRLVTLYRALPDHGRADLALVADAMTADLLARRAVQPLWQILAQAGARTDTRFIPAVASSFADEKGRLLALPLTPSTPLLYYNRDAFRKAKLDPRQAPRTWYEMPAWMEKLAEAGSACPLTTTFPAWILLENMAAWHNQAIATHDNGMDGEDARLAFNGHLMVRWIGMLASWQKSGYFSYSGRTDEAEARFTSGECAMLTSSSASYAALRVRSRFELGAAHLPFYDDLPGAPQNTLAGGSALWALAGAPKDSARGIAKFAAWLLRADVQAEWHQRTGYAPLTLAAYELTRRKGFYQAHPAQDIALGQLLARAPTVNSRGVRLAGLPFIRSIVNEELESVWNGKKTPIDALNQAVLRGNALLYPGQD